MCFMSMFSFIFLLLNVVCEIFFGAKASFVGTSLPWRRIGGFRFSVNVRSDWEVELVCGMNMRIRSNVFCRN